jgi:HEAT repeat protein
MEDEVKAAALRAIIAFKDPSTVDDLIRVLDRSVDEQWIHLNALACKALGAIGSPAADKALPSLVRGIFLRDKFSRMAFRDCAVALLRFRTAAAKALVAAIKGEDKETLKWSEEQGHVTGLIPEEASKVLGLIGDHSATDALIGELYVRNAPPPTYDAKKSQIWAAIEAQRFQNSIEALGRIGDPKAIKPLSKYLFEGDYLRRTRVPFAINFIGDPAGVPVLVECAKKAIVSGLGWFRLDCAKYLGHLAGPAEIGTMKGLLKNLEKLRKELTDYAATDPASSADFIGKLDGFKLQIASMEACKTEPSCWAGKIDDKNTHVREQAVWQLSRLAAGNPKALDALLAKVGDEDFALRNAVLDVLPRICDKRCLDAIEAVQKKEAGKARYKGFKDRMMFVHTQIATKG